MRTKSDILQGENEFEFITRCNVDFRLWCERMLGLDVEDFHMEWYRTFRDNTHSVIEAPRGHGKTEILGVAFPLWVAFFNESKQFLVVSETQDQSKEILQRMKNYIHDNEILKSLIPEKKSWSWTKTEMNTSTRCKIYCKPYNDKIRGDHVNWVLCDEASKYKEKRIYREVITPTIENKNGHMMSIGTPEDRLDLLAELMKNPMYKGKIYRAITKEGKPLWPKKFPLSRLEDFKRREGIFVFNKEYMCNPISSETSLYPFEIISKGFDDEGMLLGNVNPETGEYYLGGDFALSAAYRGDYSVFIVVRKEGNKVRIVHMTRYKGVNKEVQINDIKDLHEKFNNTKNLLDESTFGKTMVEDLRLLGVPVEGFKFQDKRVELLESLRAAFDQQRIIIPVNPNDPNKSNIDVLLQELTEMTSVELPSGKTGYKPAGMHDDTVIALALAVKAAMSQRKVLDMIGVASPVQAKSVASPGIVRSIIGTGNTAPINAFDILKEDQKNRKQQKNI